MITVSYGRDRLTRIFVSRVLFSPCFEFSIVVFPGSRFPISSDWKVPWVFQNSGSVSKEDFSSTEKKGPGGKWKVFFGGGRGIGVPVAEASSSKSDFSGKLEPAEGGRVVGRRVLSLKKVITAG